MRNRKNVLKNLTYIAFAVSVAVNLLFAASVIFNFNVRKKIIKLKHELLEARREQPERPLGRWHTVSPNSRKERLTARQKELIKQLESVGYLAGSRAAPKMKNVTIYNKDLAYNGLNLYVSGHASEAILMDMQGNELHTWSYDLWSIWPDFEPSQYPGVRNYGHWRRAHLLENGDLLAIFEGIGLIKLDKDSNLLWVFPGKAHHDLFVDHHGKIYVLTRKAGINPKYNKNEPILEDFIVVLNPDGKEIKRVSILQSLENSRYAPILSKMKKKGDVSHTNTIEVLDGKLAHRSPAFREGNVLISILYLDVICVLDLEAESVVWALGGLWRAQHQPTILKNGNMLLFDNRGNNGKSRVIEFNPFSQEVFWLYTGTPDDSFFSKTCGSSQRLPNGNTLISETDAGRAFEVTPDKTIVWEFLNPHRAGKNDELIASLFEMIRIGPRFPLDWLDKKPDYN